MTKRTTACTIIAAILGLAGCGTGHHQDANDVAMLHDGLVMDFGARDLPEGHPPVFQGQPALPPGHPPLSDALPILPEGHPALPEGNARCPAGGRMLERPLQQRPHEAPMRAPVLIST